LPDNSDLPFLQTMQFNFCFK